MTSVDSSFIAEICIFIHECIIANLSWIRIVRAMILWIRIFVRHVIADATRINFAQSNHQHCQLYILLQRGRTFSPFSHTKFTRSPSKLSFGTGSTRLRLLRGNRTSHAHNHDLCKGGAQDAAQMQPRERMQLHQLTHGTLLTHTSLPRPFFDFFF